MSNKELTVKRIFSLTAFVGTILIGISLLLQTIFAKLGVSVAAVSVIRNIGEILAFTITAIAALSFVKTKRKPVWYIIYAVCVTLIFALVILRFTI